MRKHTAQRLSSIVPFWSTFLILYITIFDFKRKKVTTKYWLLLYLYIAMSFLTLCIANAFSYIQKEPLARLAVTAIVTTVLNFILIELQIRSTPKKQTDSVLQNHKKHTAVIIVTAVICSVLFVVLSILVVVFVCKAVSENMSYNDTNGPENHSLVCISQEELVTSDNHYSGYMSSGKGSGGQTNVDLRYSDDDYDRVVNRYKRINGIRILQATSTQNDILQLDIESVLKSGNAEIIITIDGQYHSHIPVNTSQTIRLENIAGKLVMVKAGCESAEFEVTITRTFP